ncbi:MAG: hypothetical protein K6A43_03740 [Treponema sp.]|nr:hypothetical protein [Treponema sp.]
MKRRSIFAFIALSLAMLIPAPGRFVYGVVLVLQMNLLVFLNCFFTLSIKQLGLEKIKTVLVLTFILSITILYRQLMIALQPEIVLTLGNVMYLCPISSFVIGYLFNSEEKTLIENIKDTMFNLLFYSLYALIFFLFRDLFGFGTITFFGANHMIFEKVLFNFEQVRFFTVFASLPGAFILTSCVLFLYIIIRNKMSIVKNAEVNK